MLSTTPEETALRAHVGAQIHLLTRLPGPPYRFQYATSPSSYDTAIVHDGAVLRLDSLERLARYLREVDVFAHPEWAPHLLGLLSGNMLPDPEGLTPGSFSSSNDHRPERRPRVDVGSDAVRLSLVYALNDGDGLDRLFLQDHAWRESDHGRVATADVAVRLDTHTLVIGREGPIRWTRTGRRTVIEPTMLMWNPDRARMIRLNHRLWRVGALVGASLLLGILWLVGG